MPVSTHSWNSAPTASGDAAFRKWVQGIHDSMIAAGLVQTSDTGQFNLTTGAVPTAANTNVYLIYRFNDSAQATKPVFVKVEPGTGSTTGRISLFLTVGSGSNGSGTINGTTYLPRTIMGNTGQNSNESEYPSYGSGDGSSVSVVLWPGYSTTGHQGGFLIHRSCGTDGTYNADALLIASLGAGRFWNIQGLDGLGPGSESAKWTQAPVVLPSTVNNVDQSTSWTSSTLSEDGVTAPVMPVPCAAPGVAPWVPSGVAVIHPGDAGSTSVIQVATINGASRTLRAFPFAFYSSQQGVAAMGTLFALPAIAWAV